MSSSIFKLRRYFWPKPFLHNNDEVLAQKALFIFPFSQWMPAWLALPAFNIKIWSFNGHLIQSTSKFENIQIGIAVELESHSSSSSPSTSIFDLTFKKFLFIKLNLIDFPAENTSQCATILCSSSKAVHLPIRDPTFFRSESKKQRPNNGCPLGSVPESFWK